MKILLASPRGFCAGVERAIEIVERALKIHDYRVYVHHEVVHNKFVVNNLRSKGAIFIENINKVPKGEVVIFSAHGVSQKIRKETEAISSTIYDATCPLVTKVHKEVKRKQKQNYEVILIGHKGHPEVEGTLGQSANNKTIKLVETINDVDNLKFDNSSRISYTTQTTLSVYDTEKIVTALKNKFPDIKYPKKNDICYATQNRQNAVKKLIKHAQILLVLGSSNSSNSNRLKEIATKMHKPAYLINTANDIDNAWLKDVDIVGITAGASAPEILVQNVIAHLCKKGPNEIVEIDGINENIHFPVPKKLINQS